jgi:2-polyprenyl-6-methoxyphenol hydroxylase-like FAD-dependent oxidoreductase
VFDILEQYEPFVANYSLVRTHGWVRGSVGLIGDAAHALPPTLGQGANLALVNGRSLITFVSGIGEPTDALVAWEEAVRPITEATQTWSYLYDRATTRWPERLAPIRNGIVRLFGAVPGLNQRMRVAERTPPVTSLPIAIAKKEPHQ